MKKAILFGLAGLIVIASFMAGCEENGDGNGDELKTAPSFSLTDIDGNSFSLSSFSGKVVILDFMYVACQFCDDEMEELQEVYDNYDDNDVVIITIDMLASDDEDDLRQFKEDYGDNWTYALDTADVWDDYSDAEHQGVPMIVIVNQDGKIYYQHNGLTSYNTISSKLDELL